jgi:hypothetical protein
MSISETWASRSPQFFFERFKPMMMSDPKPDPEDEGGEGESEKPAGDPASNEPEQEAAKPKEQPAETEKKSEEVDPRRKWNRASRELRPATKEPGYQTR